MNAREFAPAALRIGMALVVLWFGISQLLNPADWVGFLPSWMPTLGMSATTHIILNGTFEVVMGILLLTGLFTRVAATLASLHMFAVTVAVGYTAVGIRDYGLFCGLVAVALYGSDQLSLDALREQL